MFLKITPSTTCPVEPIFAEPFLRCLLLCILGLFQKSLSHIQRIQQVRIVCVFILDSAVPALHDYWEFGDVELAARRDLLVHSPYMLQALVVVTATIQGALVYWIQVRRDLLRHVSGSEVVQRGFRRNYLRRVILCYYRLVWLIVTQSLYKLLFLFSLFVLYHHFSLVEHCLPEIYAVLFCKTDRLLTLLFLFAGVFALIMTWASFLFLVSAVISFHAHLALKYFALPYSDLIVRQRPVLLVTVISKCIIYCILL